MLEYFFWFRSRLHFHARVGMMPLASLMTDEPVVHFHARVGMIPLGGNTVFMRRSLVEQVGAWDGHCLTEDAEIGLQLSAIGERIRVVYDPRHVTREETPDSVGAFVRQRTRWNQGFIQVLRKGIWCSMPTTAQRALAVYTLGYPLVHAIITLTWPLAIVATLALKLPVAVRLIAFLPLYALIFQLLASVIGAFAFTREYGFRMPLTLPFAMIVTFVPFQWLLGLSAIRAAYRELLRRNEWEKTGHLGAHRRPAGSGAPQLQPAFVDAFEAHQTVPAFLERAASSTNSPTLTHLLKG